MSDVSGSYVSILALILSAIGAVVSLIATSVALYARRDAKRALVSKEGVLPKSDNIEEYSDAIKNGNNDEDDPNA